MRPLSRSRAVLSRVGPAVVLSAPVLSVLVLAGCGSSGSTGAPPTTGGQGPASATSTVAAGAPGSSVPSGSSTTIAPGSEATATTNPPTATGGGAIVVTSPGPHQTVASPVTVTGRSRLATLTVELSDATGTVLASATARPTGGTFSVTLRFATTQPEAGTLTAFASGPGGARQDITQVPVQLTD